MTGRKFSLLPICGGSSLQPAQNGACSPAPPEIHGPLIPLTLRAQLPQPELEGRGGSFRSRCQEAFIHYAPLLHRRPNSRLRRLALGARGCSKELPVCRA